MCADLSILIMIVGIGIWPLYLCVEASIRRREIRLRIPPSQRRGYGEGD